MTEGQAMNDFDAIRAGYHWRLISEALDLLDSSEMAQLAPALKESFRRYLEDRIPTGSFLRACLENDFAQAVLRAHPSLHLGQLKLVAVLLNGGFPAMAWGSPEKVAAWLDKEKLDVSVRNDHLPGLQEEAA